jgi:hypothetical protein
MPQVPEGEECPEAAFTKFQNDSHGEGKENNDKREDLDKDATDGSCDKADKDHKDKEGNPRDSDNGVDDYDNNGDHNDAYRKTSVNDHISREYHGKLRRGKNALTNMIEF